MSKKSYDFSKAADWRTWFVDRGEANAIEAIAANFTEINLSEFVDLDNKVITDQEGLIVALIEVLHNRSKAKSEKEKPTEQNPELVKTENKEVQKVYYPITELKEEDNIRDAVTLDADSFNSLVESIGEFGVLQAITIDENKTVVAGHRRFWAAKEAGLAEIPCIMLPIKKERRTEIQLVENYHRENLSPVDFVRALAKSAEIGKLSNRQLSKRYGISEAQISTMLGIVKDVPADILDTINRSKKDMYSIDTLATMRKVPADSLREYLDEHQGERITGQSIEMLRIDTDDEAPKTNKKESVSVLESQDYSSIEIPDNSTEMGLLPLINMLLAELELISVMDDSDILEKMNELNNKLYDIIQSSVR